MDVQYQSCILKTEAPMLRDVVVVEGRTRAPEIHTASRVDHGKRAAIIFISIQARICSYSYGASLGGPFVPRSSVINTILGDSNFHLIIGTQFLIFNGSGVFVLKNLKQRTDIKN